jgi:hypothetical protein
MFCLAVSEFFPFLCGVCGGCHGLMVVLCVVRCDVNGVSTCLGGIRSLGDAPSDLGTQPFGHQCLLMCREVVFVNVDWLSFMGKNFVWVRARNWAPVHKPLLLMVSGLFSDPCFRGHLTYVVFGLIRTPFRMAHAILAEQLR